MIMGAFVLVILMKSASMSGEQMDDSEISSFRGKDVNIEPPLILVNILVGVTGLVRVISAPS